MTEFVTGWLSVDDEYVGDDENYNGTTIEVYVNGPYLGASIDVVGWLRQHGGKRVRITLEEAA